VSEEHLMGLSTMSVYRVFHHILTTVILYLIFETMALDHIVSFGIIVVFVIPLANANVIAHDMT
jgi:hypothetical protein